MSPLDLRGPQFLVLYGALLGVAVGVALAVRHLLRGPRDPAPIEAASLEPYEIAYLAGGTKRALIAAVAVLTGSGHLEVDSKKLVLTRKKRRAGGLHAFEAAVHGLTSRSTGRSLRSLRGSAGDAARELGERGLRLGLLLPPARHALVRAAVLLPFLVLAGFGAVKISIGLQRDRPVGFLVLACLVTVGLGALVATRTPARTLCGDRLLRSLSADHGALSIAPRYGRRELAHEDLVLAVALFGPEVTKDPWLVAVHRGHSPWGGLAGVDVGGGGAGGGGDGGGCGCGGCGGD